MSTGSSVSPVLNDIPTALPSTPARGYAAYAVATALIHSGRFNIRGREYPAYGFCVLALQDLVANLAPTALVIPQFEFDAFTVTHSASISLIDSIASLPQPDTRGPVPDFVIVLMRAILTTTGKPIPRGIRLDSFLHWGKVKIENLVPGAVVEVKRRPTRSANSAEDFESSLVSRLQEARRGAISQAHAGFLAHEGTDRLILLAWSGEWYSWRLAVRQDLAIIAMPLRQIESEEEAGVYPEEDQESDTESDASSDWESVPLLRTDSKQDTDASDPATPCPTGTGGRSRPPRASKSEATREGFFTYKDPLAGVTDTKVPYNPRTKSKGQKTEKTEPGRKPKKAAFRRYTPADLVGVLKTQRLLTEEECEDPDLFRQTWSPPILFGTPESEQNLSLIYRFLERVNTDLNVAEVSDDGGSQDQDRGNNAAGEEDETGEMPPQFDLDEYSTENSDYEEQS